MLLNELNQNPLKGFKKTSKMLEAAYGIKLSLTNDLNKLHDGAKKAKTIVESLKYQGKAIDNAEVSKYNLIAEAMQYLIIHENKQRLDELKHGYENSGNYRHVIDALSDFVVNTMDIGDSFDDAVYDAMKQYRSSKYRYPDYEIESDVRREVLISQGEELPNYTQVTSLLDNADQEEIVEGEFYDPKTNHGSVNKSQQNKAGAYLNKAQDVTYDGQEDEQKVSFKNPGKTTRLSPAQRAALMRNMRNNESVVESAIAQMLATTEGTLVEGEETFDDDQLNEVALIISEASFYDRDANSRKVANAYLDFKGSSLSLDGDTPEVTFGKDKEKPSAMDRAKIAAIKARSAKQ